MKILIKSIACSAILFFATDAKSQLTFGVKAGLNGNNISQDYEDKEEEIKTKMKIGFQLGAVVDYGLNENMSIQSGLLFNNKGYNVDLQDGLEDGESLEGKHYASYNYLEIPINFVYKLEQGLQFSAGPYFAFGLGGKVVADYTYKSAAFEFNINDEVKLKPKMGEVKLDDLEDNEEAYKGLDVGFNFAVGYAVGPVVINLGYAMGLSNTIANYEGFDNKDKEMNRTITLSATYFFGGN